MYEYVSIGPPRHSYVLPTHQALNILGNFQNKQSSENNSRISDLEKEKQKLKDEIKSLKDKMKALKDENDSLKATSGLTDAPLRDNFNKVKRDVQ